MKNYKCFCVKIRNSKDAKSKFIQIQNPKYVDVYTKLILDSDEKFRNLIVLKDLKALEPNSFSVGLTIFLLLDKNH